MKISRKHKEPQRTYSTTEKIKAVRKQFFSNAKL